MDIEGNWIFNYSVEDYLESVNNYERVIESVDGEQVEYEFLDLRLPTEQGGEAVIEVYLEEDVIEINHETDTSVESILEVLDNSYPPTHIDDLWIGDEKDYGRRDIDGGFSEDIHTLEFYRNKDPVFDIEWLNLANNSDEGCMAPNGISITSYDTLGTSLDRFTAEPIIDFTIAGIRSDLEEGSKGQLLKDLFRIIDYGIRDSSDPRMLEYFDGEEFGRFIDETAAD